MNESDLEVFYWRGQKRYKCPRKWEDGSPCAFDTYDLAAMREHMGGPHSRTLPKKAARAGPVPVTSPIVDPNGRPIVRTVDPEFKGIRFKE